MTKQFKLPSNKSFGLVFFIFFLLISIYPIFFNQNIRIIFFIISIIFLFLGLINSKILTPLNKLWMKFGYLMGKIVSPLVMTLIFYLIITPIAILLRIIGKDVLKKHKTNSKTYWNKRETKSNMKDQF